MYNIVRDEAQMERLAGLNYYVSWGPTSILRHLGVNFDNPLTKVVLCTPARPD
jgi:hypothetical protein